MEEWTDVVHHWDFILVLKKKEGDAEPCYTVGKPWGHDAQWKKPDTEAHTVWPHSQVVLEESEPQRQEVDGGAGGGGRGQGVSVSWGVSIFWDTSSVDEWWEWLHYLQPLNHALKMVKMTSF